ncbi:MAG: hypothetical protein R3Y19_00695 [Rikenellaceae bacterium]
MKKLLLLVLLALLGSANSFSQTYSYKYMCSITEDGDQIVKSDLKGDVFKFSFVDDFSVCYLLRENGEVSGWKFVYIGVEDDMLKYEDQSEITLVGGPDYLYFAKDYTELLWDCVLGRRNTDVKSIRYLVLED